MKSQRARKISIRESLLYMCMCIVHIVWRRWIATSELHSFFVKSVASAGIGWRLCQFNGNWINCECHYHKLSRSYQRSTIRMAIIVYMPHVGMPFSTLSRISTPFHTHEMRKFMKCKRKEIKRWTDRATGSVLPAFLDRPMHTHRSQN